MSDEPADFKKASVLRARVNLTFQRARKVGAAGVKPQGRHGQYRPREIGHKLRCWRAATGHQSIRDPRTCFGRERLPEAEEAQYGYYDDYCSYEPDKIVHGRSPYVEQRPRCTGAGAFGPHCLTMMRCLSRF